MFLISTSFFQADQLFDFTTSEFRCTFCGNLVEEDISALPKKDSRLLLAKFNEQLQPLYDLLREVEEIKLAPECLEPEPVDIDTIRGLNKQQSKLDQAGNHEQWSGEATRNQGFAVEETRVDVTIGDENTTDVVKIKDRPIWMTESTVINTEHTSDLTDSILQKAAQTSTQVNIGSMTTSTSGRGKKETEDIMAVLLQHERQSKNNNLSSAFRGLGGNTGHSSDSSDEERNNHHVDMRKSIYGTFCIFA